MTTPSRKRIERRPVAPVRAPEPTEAQFQRAVIHLCKYLHLHVAHFRPALTSRGYRTAVEGNGAGFPDLVIAGPRGVLFRELKRAKTNLTPQQKEWAMALAAADFAVWRPTDLASGRITRELRSLTGALPDPLEDRRIGELVEALTPHHAQEEG